MITPPNLMLDRRQFTLATLAAAASAALPASVRAADKPRRRYKYCAFTKFLGSYDYEQLTERIAAAGFDGIEVTARKQPESYIHPDRAPEELPKLHEALVKHGLEITILTTDVIRADEPTAEPMLRTARDLGIERYRLGFFTYDLQQPIIPQLMKVQPAMRDIADMNRELGIAAIYQNHCGAQNMGATFWDLHSLIKEYPTSQIGCVFDIRHATVEGGEAWPMYCGLMKPHISALSVKDFNWNGRRSQHVPLGTGQVDPKFFQMARRSDFAGPVSVQVEYLPKGSAEENLAALTRDFAALRGWLES
jgi:sugar phosphate isomerase/epimerase